MTNYFSLILSTISGFTTLIGYLFVFLKCDEEKIIKYSLALSAGVMVSLSLFELIRESILYLSNSSIVTHLYVYVTVFIILGALIPVFINKILPNKNNLYRVGILSMLAIIIHNIPEGIITYVSTIKDFKIGLMMFISISLHNIPEGISIAVPVYYGSGNKIKAFVMCLISALSEPFGTIISHIFLKQFISDFFVGFLLAITSGIMCVISMCELLPQAFKYTGKIKTILFFILGFLLMHFSIYCLK